MIRGLVLGLLAMMAAAAVKGSLRAEEPEAATTVPSQAPTLAEPAQEGRALPKESAAVAALHEAVSRLQPGDTEEERNEHAALAGFYDKRGYAYLWLTPSGELTAKASAAIAEIGRADEWGLDRRDFKLRPEAELNGKSPSKLADAEIDITLAVLKYGRYARGGRIINPTEQLSSYLDRKPQLLKPELILDGIAASEEPDAYLRGLHPPHPQFEKLRQKYVALLKSNRKQSIEAKRLLANMEEWRWMPLDMGEFYIWNNIPEFTQRVVKNGEVIRKERIVAGEVGKQTPIFSRPLRKITFKPTWIVPDSIKVRELWPNLLRGGSLFRQWALEVHTKEGQLVNWRRVNWANTDIREYEVIQPNGSKSVMGRFKFSFPNQHTVFMHDYLPQDRWMFNVPQRTYSHGCMRVFNPINLAQLVLREDKGWDPAQVVTAVNTGPLNNEVPLDHRFPVHITYFTALVGEDGKLNMFPDVYGHERRITLALEGKWNQIVKGRDHLAPVELNIADAPRRHSPDDEASDLHAWRRHSVSSGGSGFLRSFLGGDPQ